MRKGEYFCIIMHNAGSNIANNNVIIMDMQSSYHCHQSKQMSFMGNCDNYELLCSIMYVIMFMHWIYWLDVYYFCPVCLFYMSFINYSLHLCDISDCLLSLSIAIIF